MKTTLLLIATSALWALTSAHPRAAAAAVSRTSGGYAALVPRANENGTSIVADDEPVPVFQLACDCPAVVCDPRMNAKSICECKASAAQACYIKSAGGCAMPEVDAC